MDRDDGYHLLLSEKNMSHTSEFLLTSEFSESVTVGEQSESNEIKGNELRYERKMDNHEQEWKHDDNNKNSHQGNHLQQEESTCHISSIQGEGSILTREETNLTLPTSDTSCPPPSDAYGMDGSAHCSYPDNVPYQFFAGTSGNTGAYTEVTILPSPHHMQELIYVNPTSGTVNIKLGDRCQPYFAPGTVITIKDVSLQFGSGSNFNINIIPPGEMVMMEYYHNGILGAGKEFGYAINSDGGSVTFRYNAPFHRDMYPCWTIDNQFIGNIRGNNNAVFLKVPTNCV